MLNKYLEKIVFKVKELNHKYEQDNNREHKLSISAENNALDKYQSEINLLRRDVNDLHTMIMLRGASQNIPKRKQIAFIGTGQINENVIHAYIHFQQLIKRNQIQFDGEAFFIAKTELEYDLLSKYGFPCFMWRYQPSLAYKLLETKVVVLSSHLYSNWGDCLLSHCVSNAEKIELWHGLPAKNIALSCINNDLDFHFFARLLEDCVSTKHVCIQTTTNDVIDEYKRAFPLAKQYPTGDCRTDIIFNESYRQTFLDNKSNKKIQQWISQNINNKKILYAPTYRELEFDTSHSSFYQHFIKLLSAFDGYNIKLAIKFHVGIVLPKDKIAEIQRICLEKGHLFIEDIDEVYSTFSDFDAIIVDYSSIRSDFALTGKPIFLWQFDKESYHRPTDVVKAFYELDKVSYDLDKTISPDKFINLLENDPIKNERNEFVNLNLKTFSNGKSAERTIKVILDVANA